MGVYLHERRDTGGFMSDIAAERRVDPGDAEVADCPVDQSFGAIVSRHEGALLRYACHLVGNQADEAQDLVQEAFLRLHRHRQGDTAIVNLKTWLFRVVHNLAMDTIRKRGRRKAAKVKLEDQARQRDRERGKPDRLADMERREAAQYAVELLEQLPEPQQRVLVLRLSQDLTIRQIAEVVGSTPGSVSYQLNRGLAELARQLKQRELI